MESTRVNPEIEALRQVTQDLIDSYPSEIALYRPAPRTATAAGGRAHSNQDDSLPPVKRYFQGIREASRFLVNRFRITDTGQQFHSNHVLIGVWDDDIQEGDYFLLGGEKYHVEYVHPNRDFQTKCEVVRYAS